MGIVLGGALGIGFLLLMLLGGDGEDDGKGIIDVQPVPDDKKANVLPVDLTDKLDISGLAPAAGKDWLIRKDEMLLGAKGTAAMAYGNNATTILVGARGIALHPKNAVYLTPSESNFMRKYFPEGWPAAAYLPNWGSYGLRGNSRKALQLYNDGSYGYLYIPTAQEVRDLTGNQSFLA